MTSNPFQDVKSDAQIRAIFFLDSQDRGWWQLVAELAQNTYQPIRDDKGLIRYPNGLQQHLHAMAADYGYPVVVFDAAGYTGQLDRYNDAWS